MVQKFGHRAGEFPVTEYVAARTLALPFFTTMSEMQVNRVCDVLGTVLERMMMGRKGRF